MLLACVPMASVDREPVAEFVEALYDLGGFSSWGEFARESGFLASQVSDYKRGKNSPSGPNLLRLIFAATDRAPLAMREAAERTSPVAQVHVRLEGFEEQAERGRAALTESLASIDDRLGRIEEQLDIQDGRDSQAHP